MKFEMVRMKNIDLTKMTQVWNDCWQGYYYDIRFTPAQMKFWLHLGQVSLEHSVALVENGKVVGFSLLALDGQEGWIAGTSIAPEKRRQGLFALLMQAQLDMAKEAGLRKVCLEVLKQNHARKVYRAVGFRELRQLNLYRIKIPDNVQEAWRLPMESTEIDFWRKTEGLFFPGLFRVSKAEDYFDLRSLSPFTPAWQRRENYLRRYPYLHAFLNKQGTAGLLCTGAKDQTLLDAWCSGLGEAGPLLAEIIRQSGGEIALTNQPEDWLAAYLAACQIRPQAIQYEMRVNFYIN
ncbi:MAG: GNAT family N-acetyltransferase [Desulfitobacteriaceae bacterium]